MWSSFWPTIIQESSYWVTVTFVLESNKVYSECTRSFAIVLEDITFIMHDNDNIHHLPLLTWDPDSVCKSHFQKRCENSALTVASMSLRLRCIKVLNKRRRWDDSSQKVLCTGDANWSVKNLQQLQPHNNIFSLSKTSAAICLYGCRNTSAQLWKMTNARLDLIDRQTHSPNPCQESSRNYTLHCHSQQSVQIIPLCTGQETGTQNVPYLKGFHLWGNIWER